MNAFRHNIKLIRSLTKKTQPAFAELIKTNVSNIKTWENTDSLPTDVMIYETLADISGVAAKDLKSRELKKEEIKVKVEKVDDNSYRVSNREVIEDLRDDKKRSTIREDKILSQLVANSTAMMQILTVLQRHDQAFHETILKSLSRVEGGNTDLVLEARRYEAELQIQDSLQGSNAKVGK
jgi:transcriptional regulator with XRE-family HTH domain